LKTLKGIQYGGIVKPFSKYPVLADSMNRAEDKLSHNFCTACSSKAKCKWL
jgi:hypothetical protein